MNKTYLILFTKFSREILPTIDIWSDPRSHISTSEWQTEHKQSKHWLSASVTSGSTSTQGDFKVLPIIGMALRYENRQEKHVAYSSNLQ